MNVAVLCSGYGFVSRGAETLVREVTRRLKKRHVVDVYALGRGDDVITVNGLRRDSTLLDGYGCFLRVLNLSSIPFVSPSEIEHLTFMYSAFRAMLRIGTDYHIVWNNNGLWGNFFCSRYRSKKGTPFITTLHGVPFSRLRQLNYGKIFSVPMPQPDHVICLSETYVGQLRRVKAISVIPNGVDTRKISSDVLPLDLGEFGISKEIERPVVLSTSALEPIKRVPLLIYAMKKLGKGTLIVANDGTQKQEVLKLGRSLLGERFIYLGVLSSENLARAYAICDVFCLPSKREAFGMVMLEALAANKPVIAELDMIKKKIVGDAGILLKDISDIHVFAKAIETAHCHDFDDKPRKRALMYDWEKISKEYEQIMIDVANQT